MKDVPIYMGVDAATSPTGDDCAAIAFYPDGDYVKLAFHRLWRAADRTEILRLKDTVEPYIERVHRNFWLAGVYYDPYQLIRTAEELTDLGVRMIPIKQSAPELGPLGQKFFDMVAGRSLVLYDHPDIRSMHRHAAVREIKQGLHIKKSGRGKVDLLVAASFAAPHAWTGTPIQWAKLGSGHKQASRWNTRDNNPGPETRTIHRPGQGWVVEPRREADNWGPKMPSRFGSGVAGGRWNRRRRRA